LHKVTQTDAWLMMMRDFGYDLDDVLAQNGLTPRGSMAAEGTLAARVDGGVQSLRDQLDLE